MTSFSNVKSKTKEDAKRVEDRIVKDANMVETDIRKPGHELAEDMPAMTKKMKDII
jgi:hypothetical protein